MKSINTSEIIGEEGEGCCKLFQHMMSFASGQICRSTVQDDLWAKSFCTDRESDLPPVLIVHTLYKTV